MYLVKYTDPAWGKCEERFFFKESAKERAQELREQGQNARVSPDKFTRKLNKEARQRANVRRVYVGD